MITAYNSIICVYTYKSLDEFLDNMLDTWFHGESMWHRRNRGIRTPPTAGGIPCQVPAAVRILGSASKISQNYHLVMTNIAMENHHFLMGKPSISMGHLYHGYVSHNQMVVRSSPIFFWGFSRAGYLDTGYNLWPFREGKYEEIRLTSGFGIIVMWPE